MKLYGILRRNGWASPDDLQAAAARSTEEGDKDDSGVRWIRSYVLSEGAVAARERRAGHVLRVRG